MAYELLLREAEQQGIEVCELPLRGKLKGLYYKNAICINRRLSQTTEKNCILAEELGHHHTSVGNILDQSDVRNRKQEQRARSWAYERLVPLNTIVQAHRLGVRNRFELAEYLNVTEDFLEAALNRFQEKYGLCVPVGKYTVCFEPLGVIEFFE